MHDIEKYLKLYDLSVEELVEKAHKITEENFKRKVEFCSIISAKTGACPENCKYCSQSVHYDCNLEYQKMIDKDVVYEAVNNAKKNGIKRFAIVTSGTKLNDKDFKKALELIKTIKNEGISPCACLGMLDLNQMKLLVEAGCNRYNHNINTNKDYYWQICTTHTYEDRIRTINYAKEAGMETCVGIILGMGETREDRIKMALEIKEIGTDSVPINVLDPIKGTPLENYSDKITEDEVIKTICIFRMILPNVYLRFAGGRKSRLSKVYQRLGIFGGINSIISGDYLTTSGEKCEEDEKMLELLGYTKE